MRFHSVKLFWMLWTVSLLALRTSSGGEVRIAFLQDTNSLDDTLRFLTFSGCTQEGIKVFTRAVRQYYDAPFDFDFSKFPKPTNGFYSFASPQDLITALPTPLVGTNHFAGFCCTDAVSALVGGRLRTTIKPDDIIGPLMVTTWATNSSRETVVTVATTRDAYNLGSSPGYIQVTEPLFPETMRDARVCLRPLLLQWQMLPLSVTNDDVETKVMEVLRAAWQREGLKFSSQFEVVLLHSADISSHSICTRHTGLLFRSKQGYTYIEKAGGQGPFVRLNVTERADLMPWFNLPLANCANTNCHHFATFNDSTIIRISRQ